jgi:hypothetical protein
VREASLGIGSKPARYRARDDARQRTTEVTGVRLLTAEISKPLCSERAATTVVPLRPGVSREAPRRPHPQSEPPFIEQARRKAGFNRRRPFVVGRLDSPVTWPGRAGREGSCINLSDGCDWGSGNGLEAG